MKNQYLATSFKNQKGRKFVLNKIMKLFIFHIFSIFSQTQKCMENFDLIKLI